jgi:hypothetical protein
MRRKIFENGLTYNYIIVNPISLNRIYNKFPSLVDVCKSLSKDLIIGIIISTPENIKLPLLSGNLVLFKINSQTTSDDEVYDIRKSGVTEYFLTIKEDDIILKLNPDDYL